MVLLEVSRGLYSVGAHLENHQEGPIAPHKTTNHIKGDPGVSTGMSQVVSMVDSVTPRSGGEPVSRNV